MGQICLWLRGMLPSSYFKVGRVKQCVACSHLERKASGSQWTDCMHIENFACSEPLFWWGRRARVSLCHPGWTGTRSIARMTLNSWPSSCLMLWNTRIIYVSPHTQNSLMNTHQRLMPPGPTGRRTEQKGSLTVSHLPFDAGSVLPVHT